MRLITPGLFILVLIACLSACGPTSPNCASLPGGGQYCLQATSLAPEFEVQQQVLVRFRDRQETMIASVENDAQQLDFVGLTPFGQKLIHMRYDNQAAIAILSPDQRIKPAMMLALLQLALWPAEAVQQGLDAASLVSAQEQERNITHQGKLVMHIHYENPAEPGADMQINLPEAALHLEIKRLETSAGEMPRE